MLDKNDLKQIEKIVGTSAETTKKDLRKEIVNQVDRLDAKIESTKNEIITIISREITDLAEINREVIKRVDLIGELDKRITRLEAKFGLKPF